MGKTYAYIDGAFIRDRATIPIEQIFGSRPELDLSDIRGRLSADRIFYYDCAEDKPRQGETEDSFLKRTEAHQRFLSHISRANLCHVRLGTLKQGYKRITQKEVDVKIAVDMLTHAANRSIDRAVLVASDMDLRPAVESVVQLGPLVELWYDPLVTAPELIVAADVKHPIRVHDWWGFISPEFRKAHPLPQYAGVPGTAEVRKTGQIGQRSAKLLLSGQHAIAEIDYGPEEGTRWVWSLDLTVLERFLSVEEGNIDWH